MTTIYQTPIPDEEARTAKKKINSNNNDYVSRWGRGNSWYTKWLHIKRHIVIPLYTDKTSTCDVQVVNENDNNM